MSVERFVELSQALAQHQKAFNSEGGFSPTPDGDRIHYCGYGGELPIQAPDGSNYEAYADGWGSSIRFIFFGPSENAAPGLKEELGSVQITQEDSGVRLLDISYGDGDEPRSKNQSTDRPDLIDLVQPLGVWLVNAVTNEEERRGHNAEIDSNRAQTLKDLHEKLSIGSLANREGVIDPEELRTECDALVRSAIADIEARTAVSLLLHPTLVDIAPLEEFLRRDVNTTVGYNWTSTRENRVLGIQLTRSPQQLLWNKNSTPGPLTPSQSN